MVNEVRLIDANVAKEMIVNHANEFSDVLNRREKALLIGGGTSCIDRCPTVDAVPVVRCRDCKHWILDQHGCVCNLHSEKENEDYPAFAVQMLSNDFCSYGERKDNG